MNYLLSTVFVFCNAAVIGQDSEYDFNWNLTVPQCDISPADDLCKLEALVFNKLAEFDDIL